MPPFITHIDDVPENEGRYPAPFDAEALTFGRDLGRAAGVERLGTYIERLPAGRRTSRLHAHAREEETVFVLAGTPVLRWRAPGGPLEESALRKGSFGAFRAGTGIAHSIYNPGPEEAQLLVVGERQPGDRVVYPDDPALEAWRTAQGSNRRWTDVRDPHPQAHAPAWRIRTPRCELRPWRLTDVPAFVALQNTNRDHLLPWMPWAATPATDDDVAQRVLRFHAAFAKAEEFFFGVFLDGAPIGGTGLHLRVGPRAAEIGYWIDHAHQGKGLMSEVVRAIASVGLMEHGYDRVEIRMDPRNVRSSAIPARLGFTLEAMLPRRATALEGLHDVQVWSLYHERAAELYPTSSAPIEAWDLLDRRLR